MAEERINMSHCCNGKQPIAYAEEMIRGFLEKVPAAKLAPPGRFTYHQGVFLSGVEQVYRQNGCKDYADYIDAYLACVLREDKTPDRIEGHFWISPDSLDFRQAGNLLFRKYAETADPDYLHAIAELTESLKDFPKNRFGGFWHMKSQPNQMWLDGLYMVGPLCARYARLTGKREFGEMALNQAVLMYEHMSDPADGLLFHGWDDSKAAGWADPGTGLSSIKWGRALGWFTVASLEILEILGESYEKSKAVRENVKKTLMSLLKVQDEKGFWHQVIDKPERKENWPETSCTCLIAYAMAKAYRLGILGEEAKKAALAALEAVTEEVQQDEEGNPVLTGICVGTCIEEGTYEYYIHRETCANDLHGCGAYLMMCAECNYLV